MVKMILLSGKLNQELAIQYKKANELDDADLIKINDRI
jgi:hypothetical protein